MARIGKRVVIFSERVDSFFIAPADGAARRQRQRQHEGDNAEPALFLRAQDVRDAPLQALDRAAEARRRGQRAHAGLHGGEQCPAVSRALGEFEPVGRALSQASSMSSSA